MKIMMALFFLSSTIMAQQIKTVVLDSPSELVQVKIMVRAGSAYDPQGLEGLAFLTARALLEGSYGDPKNPVTKEMLSDIVRPWGSNARPSVRVEKETATFSLTVPREAFPEYAARILRPLFSQPLFAADEVDRIRKETETYINSTLRMENTELLGLYALDNAMFEGTNYGHTPWGTVKGINAVKRDDIVRFYKSHFTPGSITVGVSSAATEVRDLIQSSFKEMGAHVSAKPFPKQKFDSPAPLKIRRAIIVSQPTTIATGIHLGFPLDVKRGNPDYWALYVANVFFGTHRDGFGRLYDQIRQARGYNYGDYSYIDWFEGRPFNLFPPTNVPRRFQYFSIWVRPVQHEYAHHIMKAITWELENFVRNGMTHGECESAKNKAKVLYLNLAETSDRLLGYKMDDDFYGMKEGYLDQYLDVIDKLTPEQINGAIRKHLQWKNLAYVIVTNEEWAGRLKEDIANDRRSAGKDFLSYNIDTVQTGGETLYQFPKSKLEVVQKDKVWESYRLDISADNITTAKCTQLFESVAVVDK